MPLTPSEKQKRYRERQKAEALPETVTMPDYPVVLSAARGELYLPPRPWTPHHPLLSVYTGPYQRK